MRFILNNLGKIKCGEMSLAPLTLICGNNNAGKTYVTYALYGFFKLWHEFLSVDIDDSTIETLWHDGHVELDMNNFKEQAQDILNRGCKDYIKYMPRVFATKPDRFKDTAFGIKLENDDIRLNRSYHQDFGSGTKNIVSIDKKTDSTVVTVSLLVESSEAKITKQSAKKYIEIILTEMIFGELFPKTYIASTERTGAAIFRRDLYFARNRLLEQIGNTTGSNSSTDIIELAFRAHKNDYPLPVQDNVEFSRSLEDCGPNQSYIAKQHHEILESFADIIGGDYQVKKDGLFYIPKGSKGTRLSMQESSSSVRSLLDIGFYLRHQIQKGDFLMIDEPELNLHPSNQRRMARLFAQLINAGINVFVTTHSDYLIRELNTLIMLNSDREQLKQLATMEKYKQEELLIPSQLSVYIAKEASVALPDKKKKQICQTLVPVKIDSKYGMEVTTFDETIREMNRIQDKILDLIEEES